VKLLYLLLILGFAGLFYSKYSNDQRLAEMAQTAKDQQVHLNQLQSELAREKRRNQSDVREQQRIVDQLKQQYDTEKGNLDSLTQRFDTARNRGLPGSETASDLETHLRQEKDALQEQRLGNRQNQVNLEAQIQQQQQLIQANQDQLKQLKSQGLVDPDTRAQIKQLSGQINDQKAQLQNLKSLRPQLAVQGGVAVNQLDGQVQDQRTQLRLSREQLEDRYRQEKVTVADLQKQLDDAKRDQGGQKQAYGKLQADYQAEKEKTVVLKAQLDQEQQRLRGLLND